MQAFRLFTSILALVAFGLPCSGGTPVVEDPLTESYTPPGKATVSIPKVVPIVPTAKALLFPISAYDDSGHLTITATSSNPNVLVRVKTGNPLMRFDVTHTGTDPSTDPSYTDTAVFQLFRDLTPESANYMASFAQGGFFDAPGTEHGRIFRIADFGAAANYPQNSFIFQGGSSTGYSANTLDFAYENEFHPAAIFAGRGQLAMANSGYSALDRGSNGTQFFLTDGPTRFLDFKHTIFAQLTHGWELLADLRATPRQTTDGANASSSTDPDYQRTDQPLQPVRITNASIATQYSKDGRVYTDAVLVISATAPGTSTITVTAWNAKLKTGQQSFTVTAQDEPLALNSRPFLTRLPDANVAPSTQVNLPFAVVDLERDYASIGQQLLNAGSPNPTGYSGLVSSNAIGVLGNPQYQNANSGTTGPYTGPLYPAVNATQFELDYRGAIDGSPRAADDFTGSTVAVGDYPVTTDFNVVYGVPGTALTNAVVARYRDADPRGTAGDDTAQINWGDGSALQTGTISIDPTRPSATGFQITGGHTYTRPGTYQIVTTLTSPLGLRRLIRSAAVISSNSMKALAPDLTYPGPTVANPVLALVTDSASTGFAGSYTAVIDWGDGICGYGTMRPAGPGRFVVTGVHTYRDAERFAYSVSVHKNGTSSDQDAVAWGTLTLNGFTSQQHLPPFDQAHLVAEVLPVPVDLSSTTAGTKPTKATIGSQTYLSYSVKILNSGNIPSVPGNLRFYLSLDKMINLAAQINNGVTNPADLPLQIKDLKTNQFFLPALAAGQSIQYYFTQSAYADYRLIPPVGETATGYNLLVQLDYHDSIADHEPIKRIAVAGPINGILVDPVTLATRESGTSATFTVKLDKQPTQNVTIPLTVDATGTTEGKLNQSSLTFTSANWNVAQTVKVTGLSDNVVDGSKTYQVVLQPATSADPFYSGMTGPPVSVTNADRDININISPTSVTTSESPSDSGRLITVSLTREPTSRVTLELVVGNPAEGKIELTEASPDPSKLLIVFDPRTTVPAPFIGQSKTFRIVGVPDGVKDGNQTYQVTFKPVVSDDPEFSGLTPAPIQVVNDDVN